MQVDLSYNTFSDKAREYTVIYLHSEKVTMKRIHKKYKQKQMRECIPQSFKAIAFMAADPPISPFTVQKKENCIQR